VSGLPVASVVVLAWELSVESSYRTVCFNGCVNIVVQYGRNARLVILDVL